MGTEGPTAWIRFFWYFTNLSLLALLSVPWTRGLAVLGLPFSFKDSERRSAGLGRECGVAVASRGRDRGRDEAGLILPGSILLPVASIQ